ncbi:Cytochrome P450 [Mycena kentingensis (nom. inval.)]|nr:Cytochrome P450 [Mycena kentingensis (nom. inval.)]
MLPPGLVYLARLLPHVLAPPVATYLSKIISERAFGLAIPRSFAIAAYVLSGPLLLLTSVQIRDFRLRREAASHGAVLAPSSPGMWGGLKVLFLNLEDLYPGEPITQISAKIGHTFSSALFFQNQLFTSSPENIKRLLATDFAIFEKGAEFRSVMEPLLGTGVFAADGEMWRFHRQITRPFFHRARISDFTLFDEHAAHALALCKARLRKGYAVDFQDMVARFTMDTATAFLFGRDVHSLDEGLVYPHNAQPPVDSVSAAGSGDLKKSAQAFAAALQEAQSVTAMRMRFGPHWPLAEFWKNRLAKPLSEVRKFLDPILDEAVQRKRAKGIATVKNSETEAEDREVAEGESLLDHLVNYTEDHTILRDEILNITVAGRDTTACVLTFTAYMLAEHPAVLAKLRTEILTVVGPTRAPTLDDFRDMRYLRAVLNETMRLYSPVYNTQPTLFQGEDGTPIYVPANTRTPYSTMVMHRRKDLWGQDALEFDPERFLDERLHKYLTPNPFIFLPFNAGPRICLGQQFAYHEASFFLVRMLQTFSSISTDLDAQPPIAKPPASWRVPGNDPSGWKAKEKIRPRSHLTLFVKGGLWVRMGEAEASG